MIRCIFCCRWIPIYPNAFWTKIDGKIWNRLKMKTPRLVFHLCWRAPAFQNTGNALSHQAVGPNLQIICIFFPEDGWNGVISGLDLWQRWIKKLMKCNLKNFRITTAITGIHGADPDNSVLQVMQEQILVVIVEFLITWANVDHLKAIILDYNALRI